MAQSPQPGAVRRLLKDMTEGVGSPSSWRERAQALLAAFPAPPSAPPVLDADPPPTARRKRPRAPWPPALRVTHDGKGKRGRWSIQETAAFQRLFGLHPLSTISRKLNRSLSGVEQHAARLFPLRTDLVEWTGAHEVRFSFLYGAIDDGVTWPARALGVAEYQVEAEADRRRAKCKTRPWTDEENIFLKTYYGNRTDEALSVVMSRFVPDIERQAQLFHLAKDKAFLARREGAGSSVMPRWTEDQIETLRRVYSDTPNIEIARLVKKSNKSVVSKAHQLGLKKSSERLVEMGRENVAVRHRKGAACLGS